MISEKLFIFSGTTFKCRFYNGYNGHFYCAIFNDATGEYIGEIEDIRDGESDTDKKIVDFLKQH